MTTESTTPHLVMLDAEHATREITVQDDILPLLLSVNPDIKQITMTPYKYVIEGEGKNARSAVAYKMPLSVTREDILRRKMPTVDSLEDTFEVTTWNMLLNALVCDTWVAKGQTRYIPMTDLAISSSEMNLETAKQKIFHQLTEQGFGPFVILESGESYHVMGLKLLSPEDRLRFFGACLMMNEDKQDNPTNGIYIDTYDVGRQLFEGISEEMLQNPRVATLVPISLRHASLLREKLQQEFPSLNPHINILTDGGTYTIVVSKQMTKAEYLKFLGSILLLNDPSYVNPNAKEFTDARYIGHRLREDGPGGLRITQSVQKPHVPRAVSWVGF